MSKKTAPAKGQEPTEYVTDLVRDLLKAYTRHHADLKVSAQKIGPSIGVTVQSHRDDHPRLVGSRGTHIWALQTIAAFIGRGLGLPVKVTLLEPWTGEKQPLQEYRENPRWESKPMVSLMEKILAPVFKGLDGQTDVEAVPCEGMTSIVVSTRCWDAAMEQHKLGLALHYLWHAMGKAGGHIVHVEVVDPDGKARDPLAHVPAAPSSPLA